MDKQQRQLVDKSIREAKEKLEAELESAKNEHQLMLMTQGVFIRSFNTKDLFQPLVFTYEHLIVTIATFEKEQNKSKC